MNLYKIDIWMQQIVDEMLFVAQNPELTELQKEEQNQLLLKQFDALSEDRDAVALDLVRAYKNTVAMEKAIAEEANALNERKRSWSAKGNAIKKLLLNTVAVGDVLEDATAKIGWRKSSVVVYDEMKMDKMPDEVIKIVKTVNKTELKKYIAVNGETEFYHIEQRQNIQLK